MHAKAGRNPIARKKLMIILMSGISCTWLQDATDMQKQDVNPICRNRNTDITNARWCTKVEDATHMQKQDPQSEKNITSSISCT
jgi:hypothetical protein